MNSSHNFKDSPDAIHAGVMATHGGTFGVGTPAKPAPKPNPYAGNTKYHSAFEPAAPKQDPGYGGVYSKDQAESDEASATRRMAAQAGRAGTTPNGMDVGDTPTEQAMNRNDDLYEMARGGNTIAAGRVKDTDAVIASAQGDSQGTEYTQSDAATGGSIAAIPGTGTGNMAPKKTGRNSP